MLLSGNKGVVNSGEYSSRAAAQFQSDFKRCGVLVWFQ